MRVFCHMPYLNKYPGVVQVNDVWKDVLDVDIKTDWDYETEIKIEIRQKGQARPEGQVLKRTNRGEYWLTHYKVRPISAYPLIRDYFRGDR